MKKLLLLTLFFALGSLNIQLKAQCNEFAAITLLQQNGDFVSLYTPTSAPSGQSIYAWDFGDGTTFIGYANQTYVYDQPGVYVVNLTVYDSTNTVWCAYGVFTVQIPDPVCNLGISFDVFQAGNGLVTLSNVNVANGVAPMSYTWWLSNGQSASGPTVDAFFNNGVQTACVFVHDAAGCADSVCMSFSVTDGLCPQNFIIAQPQMNGQTLLLILQALNTSAFPINFTVDYGDGSTESNMMTSVITLQHNFQNNDTLHNVCVYYTDVNGCSDTLCQNVYSDPCSNFFSEFTYGQANNQVNFVSTSNGTGPYLYQWNFGDGTSLSNQTAPVTNHTYMQPGTYQVCLTTTDISNGCAVSVCHLVVIESPCNQLQLVPQIVYAGMSATITAIANGPCSNYVYTWTGPGTASGNVFNATFASAGTYTITAIVSDDCGCTQSINIPISVTCDGQSGPFTTATISNGTLTTCNASFSDAGGQNGNYTNNENFTYTVFPATPGGKIRVDFNSFDSESNFDYLYIHNGNSTASPLLATLNGNLAGNTLQYTSTAADGSLTFRWTSDVSIVRAGWLAQLSCSDLSVEATQVDGSDWILTANSATNWTSYQWSIDGVNSQTTNASFPVTLSEGYHQVCVTAVSANGCSSTACASVNVPCTYQVDAEVVVNNNLVTVIINNYNPDYYYSAFTQNSQMWQQLTGDSTTFTFFTSLTDQMCIYADGACFDSTCVSFSIPNAGSELISGYVWDDANGNGLFDNNELPFANSYVTLCANLDSSSCIWAYTDQNGYYSFQVFPGTYTLNSYIWQTNYQATLPTGGNGYNFTIGGGSTITGFDFGYQNQAVTITGVVYYDSNNNGVQDTGELGAAYKAIHVGNYTIYSNQNGVYSVILPAGSYTISMNNLGAGYVLSQPASGNYTANAATIGLTYSGYNFGLYADPNLLDLEAEIYHISTVTPGFPVMNYLSYCNNGVSPAQGIFTYYWDPMLAINSPSVFNPQPSTFSPLTNSATWNFNNLAPGSCGNIYMNAPAPTSLVLGNPVFNTVIVTPLNDYNPSNNIDTLHQTVVGSWDPNDKQGVPAGIGADGRIFPNTRLSYTIRFQNTGTAPAVNVVLIDTISTDFVLETFAMNASSDDYSVQVDQSNRTIRWTFSNIMLPDSLSDPIGSIGFVNFSIDPVQNQADGTVLNNFADIYFDFNEPIRTNTTIHTIDRFLSVQDLNNGPEVMIYPNPFKTSTTFLVNTANKTASVVKIQDILGKQITEFKIESGKAFSFDASGLASGMYFYSVQNNNVTTTGKLVIE